MIHRTKRLVGRLARYWLLREVNFCEREIARLRPHAHLLRPFSAPGLSDERLARIVNGELFHERYSAYDARVAIAVRAALRR